MKYPDQLWGAELVNLKILQKYFIFGWIVIWLDRNEWHSTAYMQAVDYEKKLFKKRLTR